MFGDSRLVKNTHSQKIDPAYGRQPKRGNIGGSYSRFGVSSFSELEDFSRAADPGTLKSTQFVLEARPFNEYFLPQLSFLNPIATRLVNSEAKVLAKYRSEVVLDKLNISGDSKTQAFNFLKNNYKGLNLIEYGGTERTSGGNVKRLFHSKFQLSERNGTGTFRIDTAPYATLGVGPLKLGAMGFGGFEDLFYESSNPKIYRALSQYYQDAKEGRTSNAAYSEHIKTGNNILSSLTADIYRAQGSIILHGASFTASEFINKGAVSSEDLEQGGILRGLIKSLQIKSSEGNLVLAASGTKFDESIKQTLINSGVRIRSNKSGRKQHYNLFYVEDIDSSGTDVVYLSTRRLTEASHEELALRITSQDDPEAVEFFKGMVLSRYDFNLGEYFAHKKMTQYGYTNKQLSPFFNPESTVNYILPSRHGMSYFYEIALMNAARMNAGQETIDPTALGGYATSAYQLKHAAQHQGTLPDQIPEYIKAFDREMNTPGLGIYLNQWAISQGYGRVYKDEEGALASLTGLVGAIVDRSLGYYGNMATPDALQNKEAIAQQSNAKYKEPKEGFFQQTTTFLTNFLLTTATGVVTYFTLGLPVSYLMEEANKVTLQGLIDNSLQQGDPNFISKTRFFRELNSAAGLGFGKIGTSPQDLKAFLSTEVAKGGGSAVIHNNPFSVAGAENLLQRQRAGILFDNIIHPFISDVINPFSPTNADGSINEKWVQLRNSLDQFGEELRKPISIGMEEGSNKFIVQNVGFERQKSVAKALDNLASMLPANIAKWSFGKNYTQNANFISMGDVFSFSELTRTFENIWFEGGFHEILSRSEVVDESSFKTQVGSKIQTFARIPLKILQAGVDRFKGSDQLLGPILKEHSKLRNLQSELIKGGVLEWDNLTNTRKISGTDDEIAAFVNQVLDYQEKVTLDPSRETQLVSRASKHFEEQAFRINAVKNKATKFISDPLLNNKGKIATFIAAALGLEMIASDFLSSTKGASLWSQILVSFNHERSAPVEFAPTSLFSTGNRLLDNTAWTTFALGAGYSIASVTQGIGIEKYSADSVFIQQLEKALQNQTRKIAGKFVTGSALKEYVSETLFNRGILKPRGNFFNHFVIATTGILAAGKAGNWLAATGLNLFRSIPILGEKVFGKGEVKPNDNLMVVTDLSNYRNAILKRFQNGESLTNAQISAAYQAGVISQLLNVYDEKGFTPTVRTMAQQAPLPFIQFFLTSSTKGKTFDEDGTLKTNGITTYNVGLQTAPIMGGNVSIGVPFVVNFDGKNKFGVSLHYNEQAQNVANYFNALTSLGSTALITAGTTLLITESLKAGTELLGKKFGILEQLTEDLGQTSNLIKTAAKNTNFALETFVRLPQIGVNIVRGMTETTVNEWKQFAKPFLNQPGKINPWIRLARAIGVGSLGLIAGNNTAAIFSEDPQVQFNAGIVGAIGAGAYSYFSPQVHAGLARAANTQIASGIKATYEGFERTALSKIPRRATIPILVSTAAAWLMTDSSFGIAVGMDTSLNEKLGTVGLYAATVSTAITLLSDFGKSPEQTARQYVELVNKKDNLNKVVGLVNQYRLNQTRQDLLSYTNLAKEFIQQQYTSPSANGKVSNLLDATKADQNLNAAVKTVRDNIRGDLTDFHLNQATQQDLGRVFNNLDYQKYLKGRGPGAARAFRAGVHTTIATGIMTAAVQGLGFIASGNRGGQDALNSFYSFVDNVPIIGAPVGNVFRLITGTDKKLTSDKDLVAYFYEDPTGKKIRRSGTKLIKNTDPQVNRFNQIFGDLFAPFVLDAANAYQTIAPGIGVTFRSGEFGDFSRVNFYAQLQSAGQDSSYAIYAMTSSTLLREALKNKGEYGLLVRSNIQRILGDKPLAASTTPKQLQLMSKVILGSTAELQPLSSKERRKFTLPAMDTVMNLVTADPLISFAFAERRRRAEELSYQPLLSIQNQMSARGGGMPTSLTAITNVLDISNILRAFDPTASKQDVEMFGQHGNFNQFLSFLFGSRGNTTATVFTFKQDKKLKVTKSEQLGLEDTGEWLSYSNAYIDMNSIERVNPFETVGQIFQGLDQLASTLTGGNNLLKVGIYLSLSGVALVAGLSFASSVFLKQESTALARALELPKEIMSEGLKFRPGDALDAGHNLIIQRGSVRYSIKLPEDASMDFGYKMQDAFKPISDEVGASTKTLVNEVFEASENLSWQGMTRSSIATEMNLKYNEALGKYVDSVIDTVLNTKINNSTKFADILNSSVEDTRHALKAKLQGDISEMLQKELAAKGDEVLSSNLLHRYKLKSDKDAGKYLGLLLFDKTQWLLKEVKERLLILVPEDIDSSIRLERSLLETIKEAGGISFGSRDLGEAVRNRIAYQNTLDDLIEAGEIKDPGLLKAKGRLTLAAGSGKILKGAIAAGSVSLSIFEPFDIFGSYARLGAAQDDSMLTDDQRFYAAQGAGYTTVNSATGIGIGAAVTKLGKMAGNSKLWSKLSRLRGGKLGAVIGLVAAAGFAITAASKTLVEYASRMMNSSFAKDFIFEPLGNLYKGAINLTAHTIVGASKTVNYLSVGAIKQGAATTGIGMALGTLAAMFVAAGFVSIGAGAFAIGGALGLVSGTALGSIPGVSKWTGNLIGNASDWLSQIPLVGGLLGSKKDAQFEVMANREEFNGSIKVQTATEALKEAEQIQLRAAIDPTGERSRALFTNKTLYGQTYKEDQTLESKAGGIRGRSLMNPMIDRELAIRAQYFNQSVIGQALWAKQIEVASDPNALKRDRDKYINTRAETAILQRQLEGQKEQELNNLKKNISGATKASAVKADESNLLAAIFNTVVNLVAKEGEKKQISFAIPNSNFNPTLKEQNLNAYQTVGHSMVLATQVKAEKNEDKTIQINQNIAPENDMLVTVTRGLLNPLNQRHLVFS